MPSSRPPKSFGPPLGHSFRDLSVEYVQPTPGLVAQLFLDLAEGDHLDSVRPAGVAAITWTRDFRLRSIVDRMVDRVAWATAGAVLLRNGLPVGYEAYPGGLSPESRVEIELLPTCGLLVWIDRQCWRCARGYRVRVDLPLVRSPRGHEIGQGRLAGGRERLVDKPIDSVLASLGLDPGRW